MPRGASRNFERLRSLPCARVSRALIRQSRLRLLMSQRRSRVRPRFSTHSKTRAIFISGENSIRRVMAGALAATCLRRGQLRLRRAATRCKCHVTWFVSTSRSFETASDRVSSRPVMLMPARDPPTSDEEHVASFDGPTDRFFEVTPKSPLIVLDADAQGDARFTAERSETATRPWRRSAPPAHSVPDEIETAARPPRRSRRDRSRSGRETTSM